MLRIYISGSSYDGKFQIISNKMVLAEGELNGVTGSSAWEVIKTALEQAQQAQQAR